MKDCGLGTEGQASTSKLFNLDFSNIKYISILTAKMSDMCGLCLSEKGFRLDYNGGNLIQMKTNISIEEPLWVSNCRYVTPGRKFCREN